MNPDLHKGHRERFRKRFIDTDGNGFCHHEILELLLFYALPRVNTNETAHLILKKAGSFDKVLDLSVEELCSIKGINQSAATFVKFISDLAKKYTDYPHQEITFNSVDDINDYFIDFFKSYDTDMYLIANITQHLELMNTICFSKQELTLKSNKDIASEIMKRNPSNIIFAMYHPLKFPLPKEEDYFFCKKISDVLHALSVPISDIVVCNKTRVFSVKQKGAFNF